jgi:hypothetical protein
VRIEQETVVPRATHHTDEAEESKGVTLLELLLSAHDTSPVAGHTHTYYRYPARFSPQFARSAISSFTDPGDIVLDPFMGGGTSMVEAQALGRQAIGLDINPLAVFVATAKTDVPSKRELEQILQWALVIAPALNIHQPVARPGTWIAQGYQRNISCRSTWRVRKTLEQILAQIHLLRTQRQQRFTRCALLRTAQWALDCRDRIPSTRELRTHFLAGLSDMAAAANQFRMTCRATGASNNHIPLCLNRSVIGLENDERLRALPPPRLVLTSPPYPGVHVLYHRWQIQGRKETPAPFWIADQKDGMGPSYYTFGDRRGHTKQRYFDDIRAAFSSIACISDQKTLVIQLVAFSDPQSQMERFLTTMDEAGFEQVPLPEAADALSDGHWRRVPGRKWYARHQTEIATSREVVLLHRLRAPRAHADQVASPE